ncbi:MAG: hypothetical protein H6721_21655 [Sandaracinus sp.]|nr:hypothetical protein [Sandaracinus sp.]MCB9611960.1 hypothetical protein [Sandaracinus sp.]MCB9634742.1 hypothetical protein [Sandaracinus sp.]
MAQVNPLTRELLVKLVYYGPGLGGKTTCLQHLHSVAPRETRGQLVSLATPVDRTLYFDFLPLRGPRVRDHHVRLQLFTVPGQVYFNATRKLVLTGADGVIFVADSQPERQDANLESLENLVTNFEEQGRSIEGVPLVMQYNKQDLPRALRPDAMDAGLLSGRVGRRPSFGTVATNGTGVLEALDRLVEQVLEDLERRGVFGVEETAKVPELAPAEAGLEEQIGRATEAARAHLESSFELEDEIAFDVERAPTTRHPTTSPRSSGFHVAPLFGPFAEDVRAIEDAMASGRLGPAITSTDMLVATLLLEAAKRADAPGAEPALLASWLGVASSRWLSFRSAVRRARSGAPLAPRDAWVGLFVALDLALTLELE